MTSFKMDPDHALAILLQARLNQEESKAKNNKENLPVPLNVAKPKTSLVDPEWEVTDPCPDIHGLFLAFNDRFFWGRLQGVVVKWSPQMTSCAGICVYEGHNGLCSVRLSAPLLKLRPRSDLIETLLHEMIHAFLFVTNNNRDRDGHGPEFHKHMHRINKEAGTNITVYHSFHAEVKVYQQHWWRCGGPCQYRAPFFGMVKRAKNRAPGPNDLWWADHQAGCGGTFVKVREPEDYGKKKSKGAVKPKEGKDIRNFFKKPVPASATSNSKVGNNIFGFNNTSRNSLVKALPGGSSVNRVTGFGDLLSTGQPTSARGRPATIFSGGHVLGGGHGNCSPTVSSGQPTSARGKPATIFDGGHVLGGGHGNRSPTVSSSGTGRFSKSRLLSIGQEPECKKPNIDNEQNTKQLLESSLTQSSSNKEYSSICKCSVCNESIPREEVDVHLETCNGLKNIFIDSTIIDVADKKEVGEINQKYKVTSCPVCALNVSGDINAHLDECLNSSGVLNMFDDDSPIVVSDSKSSSHFSKGDIPRPIVETDSDDDVEIIESEDRVACPICGMRFGESKINSHVNQCLDSEDDL